jgi:hypothetical protein
MKQLKRDYALGAILTRHFFANETYFHLFLLAYHLVTWFKRLCLPPEFQTATLQTLRPQILFMPAQLRRTDNRPHLILPWGGRRGAAWKTKSSGSNSNTLILQAGFRLKRTLTGR